jgi:uncharacterized protein YaiE (UPF0345 family)
MLKVNSYFDDQVKSISFQGETLPATVGVISAGEYTFQTSQHETMNIVSGALHVQLPNTVEWCNYVSGESFQIAADKEFSVKASDDVAYLCTYS